MDKEHISSKVIDLLDNHEFEDVMQVLILCQIYFITENIVPEKQLEFANMLAKLLVSSYLEYNEENENGTSQAKH